MAQAPHTSTSDFKAFTSINHVRFAHNWVDKKQSKDNSKEDDVLNLDKEDKSSRRRTNNNANAVSESSKKATKRAEKIGTKMSMVACSPVPSTSGTSSSRTVCPNVSKSQSDESLMMSILKSIQDNQKKQDDKINSLTGKMSDIMNDYQYDIDNYEDYDKIMIMKVKKMRVNPKLRNRKMKQIITLIMRKQVVSRIWPKDLK